MHFNSRGDDHRGGDKQNNQQSAGRDNAKRSRQDEGTEDQRQDPAKRRRQDDDNDRGGRDRDAQHLGRRASHDYERGGGRMAMDQPPRGRGERHAGPRTVMDRPTGRDRDNRGQTGTQQPLHIERRRDSRDQQPRHDDQRGEAAPKIVPTDNLQRGRDADRRRGSEVQGRQGAEVGDRHRSGKEQETDDKGRDKEKKESKKKHKKDKKDKKDKRKDGSRGRDKRSNDDEREAKRAKQSVTEVCIVWNLIRLLVLMSLSLLFIFYSFVYTQEPPKEAIPARLLGRLGGVAPPSDEQPRETRPPSRSRSGRRN